METKYFTFVIEAEMEFPNYNKIVRIEKKMLKYRAKTRILYNPDISRMGDNLLIWRMSGQAEYMFLLPD